MTEYHELNLIVASRKGPQLNNGPGQAAQDPHLSFALGKLKRVGIQVTPDGQQELGRLLYAGELSDKAAAEARYQGFVSEIIATAEEQGIKVLDEATLRQLAIQIDWWPFC